MTSHQSNASASLVRLLVNGCNVASLARGTRRQSGSGPRCRMPTSLLGFVGPQADYGSAGDAIVPPLTSVLGHARVLPTARAVPSRSHAPQSFSWTGAEMS